MSEPATSPSTPAGAPAGALTDLAACSQAELDLRTQLAAFLIYRVPPRSTHPQVALFGLKLELGLIGQALANVVPPSCPHYVRPLVLRCNLCGAVHDNTLGLPVPALISCAACPPDALHLPRYWLNHAGRANEVWCSLTAQQRNQVNNIASELAHRKIQAT